MRLVVILSLLSGCSTLAEYPHQCSLGLVDLGSALVEGVSCDESVGRARWDEHWAVWLPRLAESWDTTLAANGMPPLTPALDGYRIQFFEHKEGDCCVGLYRSPTSIENPQTVELYLRNHMEHWWTAPTSHEFMHLYDWEVLGITDWEWTEMQDEVPPRHFVMGSLGSKMHREARALTMATDWD